MSFRPEERGRALTAAEEMAAASLQRTVREIAGSGESAVEAEGDALTIRFDTVRPFVARRRRHRWFFEAGPDSMTTDISIDLSSISVRPATRDRIVVSEDVSERTARMVGRVISEGRKRARLTVASVSGGPSSHFDCDEIFTALSPADLVRLIGGARCFLEPAGTEDGHSLEAIVALALGIPVITHCESTLTGARKTEEWSADSFADALLRPFELQKPSEPSNDALARWLKR